MYSKECLSRSVSPISFCRFLVIFTANTYKLRFFLGIAVNDESGELTSGEAIGVDPLRIWIELKTTLGVVTIDDSAALWFRKEGLVLVP